MRRWGTETAWTRVFVTVDRRREQTLAEAARYHTPRCWTLFSVTLLCTVCSENTSSITLRCHERSSKTNGPKVVLPQLKSSCDRDQRCRLGFKHFITSRLTAADRRRHFNRGQRKRTHPKRPESKTLPLLTGQRSQPDGHCTNSKHTPKNVNTICCSGFLQVQSLTKDFQISENKCNTCKDDNSWNHPNSSSKCTSLLCRVSYHNTVERVRIHFGHELQAAWIPHYQGSPQFHVSVFGEFCSLLLWI